MICNKKVIFLLIILCSFIAYATADEIHDATKNNDITTVKMLIDKNPKLINAKDDIGRTPLHWACRGVHAEVAKYLIDKGADVNALDNNQLTALHSVAARGYTELTDLLIKKGAQVNINDYGKHTPLHFAAIYGHKDVTALLVAKGAKLELKDDYGRTPLLLAARESGSADVAKILLDKGANIDAVDKYGDTPLSLAAWRGYQSLVDLLISRGAMISAKGGEGKELLSYSTSKGLINLFDKLVEKGVELQFKNGIGESLLHSAAVGGAEKIVSLLIEKGLDINEKNIYGWTPLHYAADKGHKVVVELLIRKGADINSRNIMGETSFNIAKQAGHQEMIDVLIANKADRDPPKFPLLQGEYLGQKKPGEEPKLFAKGIVSSYLRLHGNVIFSPDNKEAYWSPSFPVPGSGYAQSKIMFMQRENNRWTFPKILPVTDKNGGDVPFISPDGKKFFFMSMRPLPGESEPSKENIWVMERKDDGWSEPKPVDPVVNSIPMHWQFSIDKEGNLYFGSRAGGGFGQDDIYCSKFINGHYTKPENLGKTINTEGAEFSPFIAPDGGYLIFSQIMKGSTHIDLYISYREKNGTWTQAENMGEKINTPGHDLCPIVSPDGKFLFFLSTRNGIYGVYWVDARIIEELEPKEFK